MDEIIRRNRLNHLEQEFGTEDNPIFAPKREFMDEFNLFMIKEEKMEAVIVFVFNDLLMIVDAQTRKKLKQVKINETFYVRRE